MEHVLYADILFFINFSMDFITLYLTSRLTSGPPSGIRSVIAAIIGGVYGTASVALGIDGIVGVIITGAVSVVMVLTSMGYTCFSLLLKRSVIFWGAAALLGGIMTVICSIGGRTVFPESPVAGTGVLLLGSTVCLIVVRLLSRFTARKSVRIKVSLNGHTAVFDSLCDSGNLVTDPLSGIPVIIADRSVLHTVLPETDPQKLTSDNILTSKIRMIPVSVPGGKNILVGFIPDRVSVLYGKKEKRCEAIIAVSDLGNRFFGGYPANTPAILI